MGESWCLNGNFCLLDGDSGAGEWGDLGRRMPFQEQGLMSSRAYTAGPGNRFLFALTCVFFRFGHICEGIAPVQVDVIPF